MTALLYISYSSGLSEADKLAIDKSVFENRLAVRKFVRKIHGKGKVVVVSTALGILILFSGMGNADAMGLTPIHQAPIMKSNSRIKSTKFVPSNVRLNSNLVNYVYMMDEHFIRTPEVSKLIKELRGGSLITMLIGNAIFMAVLYGIWILSSGTQGFVTPSQNPGWGLPGGLYDPPGLVRPVDCGTQLYAGSPTQSLKTWEDRNDPNPKDRWFLVESRLELVMRRGQSKFKTKDHGALAGLPYSIKKNGSTSTLKTEENVDIFMDAVEEIVYDPNSLWFEQETYQGGTDREVKSINIYNEKHNRIAVFLRSTGEFITFCEPTLNELEDLSQTENFGGQDNWFSSTPKNMPPQQEFVSDFTSVNSFESDVMGITPISSMDENSSPNQGFTSLNSFESDVLEITPVNPD